MRSNFSPCRTAWLGFLLSLFWWGQALGAARTVIVHVDVPPLAWSGSTLEAKLIRTFSRSDNGRFLTTQKASRGGPAFPADLYDLDSLANWGQEVGGDYLLVVRVDSERLQRKKSFHLPLVFHKYEAIGVIEGELRLIDVRRGKHLIAEPFRVIQKGPRIFQATMDDDINDPDVHLTAPDKIDFFHRLEEKLARRVVERVGKAIRLR